MSETTPKRMVTTHTVGDGSDSITYDVHGDLAEATPGKAALFVFGSPMAAEDFGALVEQFTDRPVVTYDPRGSGRNPTGTSDITARQHAEDLHRVITDLGVGPVDAFGTSGGAVNLLALLTHYPGDVRRAVSHEPPTADLLPDREVVLSVVRDVKATYHAAGEGPAMAKFIAVVMHDGEFTRDYLEQPAPDPAMFGLPTQDDGTRTNPLMRNMPACNEYRVDTEALAPVADRLVIGVGAESSRELAARGGHAVAEALGGAVSEFPSHHAGFMSADGQMPGAPEAFGARLKALLD